MRAVWKRNMAELFALPGVYFWLGALALAGALNVWLADWAYGAAPAQTVYGMLLPVLALCAPILARDALYRDRALGVERLLLSLPVSTEARALGKCAAYLFAGVLGALAASVAPVCAAWGADAAFSRACACAIGLIFAALPITAISFLCAMRIPNRALSMCCAYAALLLGYVSPLLAQALAQSVPGVWVARALLRLSPFYLFNSFQNGVLDLRDLGMFAALAALAAIVSCRARWTKTLGRCAICGAFFLLLMLQPARFTLWDMTGIDCTTPGAGMLEAASALDENMTITLVAVPGAEDTWLDAYCERLCEAAGKLRLKRIAPVEDAEILAEYPGAAMLGAECGGEFVWMRADDCYVARESGATFEAEGCILTLLEELTGKSLMEAAQPRAVALGKQASGAAVEPAVALGAALSLVLWGIGIYKRRRRI